LVSNSGNFPFAQSLEFPKPENGQFKIIYKDKYRHVLFSTGEKTVVVTDKTRTFMNTISVFSYVLLFLIFYFIMTDLAMIHKNFWGEYSLQQLFRPNTLQKQIQSSMISLVLFSLVMVGIVTFFYFSIQYNNFHNNRLLSRADAIRQTMEQYYRDAYPQYRNRTYDVVIRQRLKMLSEIYSVDINTYNKQGLLTMATQPEIFKRNLISERMNATAFEQLVVFRRSQYTHDETIGKLSYLSAYMPFRDDNGKVLGYINFPYYGKQRSIRNDISYFLVALVNVYVLLIIGAAVAAVLLSRSITNPLAIITQNLKKVSLSKKNNPIVWANKDEIGVLVEQYNRMIGELEQSANLLAKSEREDAWREMAKQVAHEIKNPLTPMKLSIQHLQRALIDNRDDLPELTKKVTSRMIEQIDTLSNIATAFSDFARMPIGKFNQVCLKDVLENVADLFKTDELEISMQTQGAYFDVYADKEQMIRVFNNIIKNAIQSIPENVKGLITISLEEKDDICIVKINDNGVGIPEDRYNKVFEPNFTTKSSGTGLGLAMSKSIVENAGGKIWLSSVVNEGTTFYIELPKWKPTNDKAR
jgi:signal transduction histidine kinase